MKNSITLFTFVLSGLLLFGCAGKQQQASVDADSPYGKMLTKAKIADASIDFSELRYAYAATDHYDPYH